MPTIKTPDNTEIYYKDWGAGRPVVFSHGWPLNADMWEYQMTFLADRGLRCIAYDRRGFGRSSQPSTGYDYDTFADNLATVIEELDLREITLVGFSLGGGEIARYLSNSKHRTERISKAVLVASVTPSDGVDPANFNGLRARIAADRPQSFSNFFRNRFFMGADPLVSKVSEGALTWTLSLALQASLKATLDTIGAFSEIYGPI